MFLDLVIQVLSSKLIEWPSRIFDHANSITTTNSLHWILLNYFLLSFSKKGIFNLTRSAPAVTQLGTLHQAHTQRCFKKKQIKYTFTDSLVPWRTMPVNGSEKLLRLVSLENEDVSYRLEVFSVAQLLLISQRVNLSFSRRDIELHLKVLSTRVIRRFIDWKIILYE